MYILASDFLKYKVVLWVPLNTYLSFFRNKSDGNLYMYIRTKENSRLNPGFLHIIHLYLCVQVKNTKWILCSQKIGVKCAYLRFLMYNGYFVAVKILYKGIHGFLYM